MSKENNNSIVVDNEQNQTVDDAQGSKSKRSFFERLQFKSAEEYSVIIKAVIMAIILALLDHVTKLLIVKNLDYDNRDFIVIIKNLFNINHVHNRGAAFGILEGKGFLLLMIALIAAVVIGVTLRKITEGYKERYYALALVLSGIIGNSVDRAMRGFVVDFLDFFVVINGKEHHWPSFNVADICICVGVGVLMLSFLLRKPDEETTVSETE
ncbi:signal peptidase II [Lentisphaerota bacterium WC36G]|nr:signal peptidase II [Lentisphaerae bacterium WC36]